MPAVRRLQRRRVKPIPMVDLRAVRLGPTRLGIKRRTLDSAGLRLRVSGTRPSRLRFTPDHVDPGCGWGPGTGHVGRALCHLQSPRRHRRAGRLRFHLRGLDAYRARPLVPAGICEAEPQRRYPAPAGRHPAHRGGGLRGTKQAGPARLSLRSSGDGQGHHPHPGGGRRDQIRRIAPGIGAGRHPTPPPPKTRDVFAAAERIRDVTWAMRGHGFDPSTCDQLEELAGTILSASSLRDPTDRRARKLSEVLQYLERRIDTLLEKRPGRRRRGSRTDARAGPAQAGPANGFAGPIGTSEPELAAGAVEASLALPPSPPGFSQRGRSHGRRCRPGGRG